MRVAGLMFKDLAVCSLQFAGGGTRLFIDACRWAEHGGRNDPVVPGVCKEYVDGVFHACIEVQRLRDRRIACSATVPAARSVLERRCDF